MLYTPSDYNYKHGWIEVGDRTTILFQVRACNDVQIALTAFPGDTSKKTYEVVLGFNNNTKSAIRDVARGKNLLEKTTKNVLHCTKARVFWINWRDGLLQVGRKGEIGKRMFMQIAMADIHTARAVAFSAKSDPGPAMWRLPGISGQ